MPRPNLVVSKTLPYHVTARTNNGDRFEVPLERVWEELTHNLFVATVLFSVQVHALVLMPNHFHLLISTPEEDLGDVMESVIRTLTKKLNSISGRSGHVFGGPYYRNLISNHQYFSYALKYIYRNPVKAGLTRRAEDWPYSTLIREAGAGGSTLPLHYPFGETRFALAPNEREEHIAWVNRPFRSEAEDAIRKALRKKEFAISLKGRGYLLD